MMERTCSECEWYHATSIREAPYLLEYGKCIAFNYDDDRQVVFASESCKTCERFREKVLICG